MSRFWIVVKGRVDCSLQEVSWCCRCQTSQEQSTQDQTQSSAVEVRAFLMAQSFASLS